MGGWGGGLMFILRSSFAVSDSAVVKIARNSAYTGGGVLSEQGTSVKVKGSGTKLIVEHSNTISSSIMYNNYITRFNIRQQTVSTD